MSKLILLEGASETVELVSTALKYACDAIVVESKLDDRSTSRLMGQLDIMVQVAEQAGRPVVFKHAHFNQKVGMDKREVITALMNDFECKLAFVTDDENVKTRSWLYETFDESRLLKFQYDISSPVPHLIKFVRGE